MKLIKIGEKNRSKIEQRVVTYERHTYEVCKKEGEREKIEERV